MKKIMIFAAFAAALSLASCQKEGLNEVVKNDPSAAPTTESPVFTASIAGSTKTIIDASDGKVSWEEDDEITVSDASKASAVYKIESIDATTGKATFVIKTGETPLGAGPYTATYGTEPEWEQTYSETAGKLYMTAPETSGNSFTFTVQCGIMELNLTKDGELVNCIAVTGTTYGEVQYIETFTLNCDGESIDEGKSFYIALPAGNYYEIEITDNENKVCTLKSGGGVEVAANHIKPVTLPADKLNFKAPSEPFARMDADKKPSLGKDCVTKIEIVTNETELPTDEEEDSAVKMNEEGTIWQVLDGETLYIKTSATEGIKLPQDASYMFSEYVCVTEITDLDYLSTNEVDDMSGMFSDCWELTSLNLSGFITENVMNMNSMFSECSNLQELNLSSFNTENVTNMASMFFGCYSLSSLDLANFNTANVTEMSTMFGECNNIDVLDLSSFNTNKVIDMSGMFMGCSKLAILTLNSSFAIPDYHDEIFQGTGVYQEMTFDEHCHINGGITGPTRAIIEQYDNMTIDE